MIGITHPSKIATHRWKILVSLGVTLACVAAGLATAEPGWLVFALLPASVTVALWLSKSDPLEVRFTARAIEVQPSGVTVEYDAMQRLYFAAATRQRDEGAVYVAHREGMLYIPELQTVSGQRVHQFLLDRLPSQPLPAVNEVVGDYFRHQLAKHGPQQVFAHIPRTDNFRGDGRLGRNVSLALLATAIVWFIVGANERDLVGYLGGGVLVMFIALLMFLGRRGISGVNHGKAVRDASLVIGPEGLALVQAELRGELRWEQLHDIKFKDHQSATKRKLLLQVPGAQIPILDIYDAPLRDIHAEMMAYWQRG